MTALELKEYIYNNNKIYEILESIGCKYIQYHSNKNYYSCSNAIGGDCDNRTAINIKNNMYLNYCNYTRNVSYSDEQDLISLVQYNLNIDFKSAMKFLHKKLGLVYSYQAKKNIKTNDSWFIFSKFAKRRSGRSLEFQTMDENVLLDFIPCIHIDLFREGITGKTIKKFELGYSYKWKRTIFPIRYWLDGTLMGYNARSSIPNCTELGIHKYYLTPGIRKEINLYGLWENYNEIKKADYITIFEAEKSVLKRDSMMDSTGVALQGHILSDEQIRIILGTGVREIVIAMDKDISEEEVWHMCDKFYGLRKVSYIIDRNNLLGKKDSPADAQNKLYKILFKYREKYDEKKHKEYLRLLKK